MKPISKDLLHLYGARDILKDKNNWCQGAITKYTDGRVQHCLWGAIMTAGHEYSGQRDPLVMRMMNLLDKRLGYFSGIGAFNDQHSHEEVMEFLEGIIIEEERACATSSVAS